MRAQYSGTVAGRVIDIHNREIFGKEEKVAKAIEVELRAGITTGTGSSAADIAKKINDETQKEIDAVTQNQSTNFNSFKVDGTLDAYIRKLNERSPFNPTANASQRETVHKLAYLEAKTLHATDTTGKSITDYFQEVLKKYRDPAKFNPPLDNKESDLEKALNSMKLVDEQAKKMDDNLKKTKSGVNNVGNARVTFNSQPPGTLPLLQHSARWDQSVGNQKTHSNNANLRLQAGGPARTTEDKLNELTLLLQTENATKPQKNQQTIGALTKEISAVAYDLAVEESKKPGNTKPVHAIFAEKWDKLQQSKTLGLDNTPNPFGALAQPKQYEALEFMRTAITAEQTRNPHDADKIPNVLELLQAKFIELNEAVEQLQEKAKNTTNPLEREKLQWEAHNVLRLHGEIGDIINPQKHRDVLALVSLLNKQQHDDLMTYLDALEAQQKALKAIAGKGKKEFTPIWSGPLKIKEEDRTAIIAKQGDIYGDISFKVKGEDGWKTTRLESNGKPVVGLTLKNIMDAKARAEAKIRSGPPSNPGYKIDISDNRDGSIHYDAGSYGNREVLHKELRAEFDLKEAAKQQQTQNAAVTVAQPGGQTNVQHISATTSLPPSTSIAQATGNNAVDANGASLNPIAISSAAAAAAATTHQRPTT